MYKIIGSDGSEYGPVTTEQLRQWMTEGRVNAETKVLAEGATEWKTVGETPELATAAPSPPPPQLGSPTPSAPYPIAPTQPQRTNPLAITSLVLGLLAITLGMCCCYGLPFNLLGIVFGFIALSQINKRPGVEKGRGLAIAGIILSGLSLLLAIILFMIVGALNWNDIMKEFNKL